MISASARDIAEQRAPRFGPVSISAARRQSRPRRAALAVLAVGGLSLAPLWGCSPSQTQSAPRENSTLKPLAVLYGQFVGRHRGQPPKNAEEFREFIRSQGPETLASLNARDVEELFVSARDHQPYVVLYGAPPAGKGPAGAPVVAYEQVGVGGKRFVASSLGAVEEVDDARFTEWVPQH